MPAGGWALTCGIFKSCEGSTWVELQFTSFGGPQYKKMDVSHNSGAFGSFFFWIDFQV